VTATARVDSEGNITRKALIKNKEIKALLMPDNCKKLDDNTLFFVAMKPKLLAKSNFRLGTITIN